jgi:ribosomal protein L13
LGHEVIVAQARKVRLIGKKSQESDRPSHGRPLHSLGRCCFWPPRQ